MRETGKLFVYRYGMPLPFRWTGIFSYFSFEMFVSFTGWEDLFKILLAVLEVIEERILVLM